jgi:hypothetical protein
VGRGHLPRHDLGSTGHPSVLHGGERGLTK